MGGKITDVNNRVGNLSSNLAIDSVSVLCHFFDLLLWGSKVCQFSVGLYSLWWRRIIPIFSLSDRSNHTLKTATRTTRPSWEHLFIVHLAMFMCVYLHTKHACGSVAALRSEQTTTWWPFWPQGFALSTPSCFNVLWAVKCLTEQLRQREISLPACSPVLFIFFWCFCFCFTLLLQAICVFLWTLDKPHCSPTHLLMLY